MERTKFLIIIIVLLISTKFIASFDVLPMINDIVESYGESTIISAFLCNHKDTANFLKHFSRNHHQINILPIHFNSLFYPTPPNHLIYLLDLHCDNSSQLLIQANNENLFASPLKWFIYYNQEEEQEEITINDVIQIYFSNINIFVDSDVTIALLQQQGEEPNFILYKIYKRTADSAILIEDFGIWSQRNNLSITMHDKIISRRRKNLAAIKLNTCIVITNNDSLKHLTDKRDIHIDSIAKVNYVLVEHLANIVNATLHYSIQNTWGYKLENSSWSGMIGELMAKQADIGGTPLFLTADRVRIIDYIAITTPSRSKFIFRQPKLSYVTNVFILPFDKYVWASTLSLMGIIAIVLYVAVKWERQRGKILEQNTEIDYSWAEVAIITFGALCQQGTASVPITYSGRIIIIFLFLSYMFLYTSYSANIVALLQSSSTSIQTLEDMLHSRLDVGVDDTVFNRFYFPSATEPIRKAVYQQKVAVPGQKQKFYPIEEGIKRMRQGLFAFHVETGPGYKLVSEIFHEGEKCGLQEISFLQVLDPCMAIQKNSSYKKMLKVGLHLLQENGIQAREVGLIYTKKPQCISMGSTFVNVGLVDCYPALVVLVGGIVLSFILFLLEIYINARLRYYRSRRERKMEERAEKLFKSYLD